MLENNLDLNLNLSSEIVCEGSVFGELFAPLGSNENPTTGPGGSEFEFLNHRLLKFFESIKHYKTSQNYFNPNQFLKHFSHD